MSLLVPRAYYVTSGKGLSNTSELNAFDNALRDAGISHLNLVIVSSILPPKAKKVDSINLAPGTITFTVMSKVCGVEGDVIAAGLAWGIGEKHGYVVEAHARNDADNFEEKLYEMLHEAERNAGLRFVETGCKIETLEVKGAKYGSVVTAMILLP